MIKIILPILTAGMLAGGSAALASPEPFEPAVRSQTVQGSTFQLAQQTETSLEQHRSEDIPMDPNDSDAKEQNTVVGSVLWAYAIIFAILAGLGFYFSKRFRQRA